MSNRHRAAHLLDMTSAPAPVSSRPAWTSGAVACLACVSVVTAVLAPAWISGAVLLASGVASLAYLAVSHLRATRLRAQAEAIRVETGRRDAEFRLLADRLASARLSPPARDRTLVQMVALCTGAGAYCTEAARG